MGLPLWDVDLSRFDVCTDVRRVTVSGGLVKHPWSGGAVRWWPDGLRTLDVAPAIMTTVVSSGVEAALVAADRALHDKRSTVDELAVAAAHAPGVVARVRGRELLRLVDPLCESVGETRTRLILHGAGLAFQSQAPIREADSRVFAFADFLVEGAVVVEFDGRLKYRADSNGTADAGDVVWMEKRREDRIRALGFEVVRIIWSDLNHPDRVVTKIRAALARARRREANAAVDVRSSGRYRRS
jgi:very-short-patch-repair endonuclease